MKLISYKKGIPRAPLSGFKDFSNFSPLLGFDSIKFDEQIFAMGGPNHQCSSILLLALSEQDSDIGFATAVELSLEFVGWCCLVHDSPHLSHLMTKITTITFVVRRNVSRNPPSKTPLILIQRSCEFIFCSWNFGMGKIHGQVPYPPRRHVILALGYV